MGLDNGIDIKRKNNEEFDKIVWNDDFISEKYRDSWEICYWRKCWNVRNDIFKYLKSNREIDEDEFKFELSIEDVKKIIKILEEYNKKTWIYEGFGGSIWEWKVAKGFLKRQIRNLCYILAKMEDFPDAFEIYFWDSY